MLKRLAGPDGWTLAFQSRAFHEFIPGTPYPAWGVALLFLRSARRLGVSIWNRRGSRYIHLFGRA